MQPFDTNTTSTHMGHAEIYVNWPALWLRDWLRVSEAVRPFRNDSVWRPLATGWIRSTIDSHILSDFVLIFAGKKIKHPMKNITKTILYNWKISRENFEIIIVCLIHRYKKPFQGFFIIFLKWGFQRFFIFFRFFKVFRKILILKLFKLWYRLFNNF